MTRQSWNPILQEDQWFCQTNTRFAHTFRILPVLTFLILQTNFFKPKRESQRRLGRKIASKLKTRLFLQNRVLQNHWFSCKIGFQLWRVITFFPVNGFCWTWYHNVANNSLQSCRISFGLVENLKSYSKLKYDDWKKSPCSLVVFFAEHWEAIHSIATVECYGSAVG